MYTFLGAMGFYAKLMLYSQLHHGISCVGEKRKSHLSERWCVTHSIPHTQEYQVEKKRAAKNTTRHTEIQPHLVLMQTGRSLSKNLSQFEESRRPRIKYMCCSLPPLQCKTPRILRPCHLALEESEMDTLKSNLDNMAAIEHNARPSRNRYCGGPSVEKNSGFDL